LGSVSLQAADLSGVWQGSFPMQPVVLVLHQDGANLSGTAGPSERDQQMKLENVKLEGDRITASAGGAQLDLRIQGDTLAGDVTVGAANPPTVFHLVLKRPGAEDKKFLADLKFEVASVKPSVAPEGEHGSAFRFTQSQLFIDRATFQQCIAYAYGLNPNDDIAVAGPAWMKSEYFSIVAKLPPNSDWERNEAMLQNLLAERFKLAVHRETKEVSGYVMLPAKGGFKLKETETRGGRMGRGIGPGMLEMPSTPMAGLAQMLSMVLDQPVENQTGITGAFDISLRWTPEEMTPGPDGIRHWSLMGSARNDISAVIAAMQQQLGLKLEPRKLKKDIVVVDHAEKVPDEI
jgi:uncharacterized protein (TIGR03435 family)